MHMNTSPDLPPIHALADSSFSSYLDDLRSLVSFDFGDIHLADWEDEAVEMLAYKIRDDPARMGCPDSKVFRLMLEQGITAWVASQGIPMRVPEVSRLHETYPDCRARYYPYWNDAHSELAVPVLWEERVVGVINLEAEKANYFTAEDEQVVSEFAAGKIALLMASAAKQFHPYRQALRLERQRREQLSNLMQLALHTTSLDMVSPQNPFMNEILNVFPEFNACNICLCDKQAEELLSVGFGHRPANGYSEIGYRLRKGQSIAYDDVIEPREKHCYVSDIQNNPRFQWQEFARKNGLEQMICLLLPGDSDDPLGCFMLFTQDKNYVFPKPNSPDEKLFEDLAEFIAGAFRVQAQQLIQSARAKVADVCSGDPLSYKTMNAVASIAHQMTGTGGCLIFLTERGSQEDRPVLRLKGTTGLEYLKSPERWVLLDAQKYPTVIYSDENCPDEHVKAGYISWEGRPVRLAGEVLPKQAPDQFLEIPLMSQERLLGKIRVVAKIDNNRDTVPLTPLHRDILQVMGDQIVSALLRAEVEANDRAHRTRLKLWDEFVETLVTIKSGGESPDQYLCDLVQRIIEELGCDTGSITMYDPNDGALHYQRFLLREGTEDQKRQYEDKARKNPRPIGSGKSLVGEAYATRKTVNWPDMQSLEYQRRFEVQSIHPKARAWLAVPILFGDNCYGVMAWTSFSPGYFTEQDEKTVQRAAKLGALYIFVRSLLQEKDDLLQEKDNFMATISHQLVAPLTSLEESCSQLLDSDLPANIRRQLLTDVHDAATLALHIAHNYKSVRRWLQTSEELHVATIPVDLAGLVASIADLFRPIAYKNPISVEYPPASQALHVLGDENLLKHILINLMDNAVKYSNPNTDIQVRLERSEEGYGVVRIHNIGPFIDEQERKQIFNFGYRGASARNRNSAGTGIGLTVAEAITQAHHGRLSVDSCVRNEKKGEADIEFILKIPLDSTQ